MAVSVQIAVVYSTLHGHTRDPHMSRKEPRALHRYQRGGHGFGMVKQGCPSDRWIERLHDWLTDLALS